MPKQKPLLSKGFINLNLARCTKTNSYCTQSDIEAPPPLLKRGGGASYH